MKRLLILLILAATIPLAMADDAGWSKPDHELRARLFVLPAAKGGSVFCRVFIEFENVANVLGQRKIRFSPGQLKLRVTGKDGKELARSANPYDGISSIWEPIALPRAGNIKFQISSSGLAYNRATDKVIVDVEGQAWIIPQNDSTYFLSATFSIERQLSDHPFMDWSGTLELPKVEIPKAQ